MQLLLDCRHVVYISPHSVDKGKPTQHAALRREKRLLTYDLDHQLGSVVRSRRDVLDFAQDEHPVDDSAEHDVFAVQKVAFLRRDEELHMSRSVTIGIHKGGNAYLTAVCIGSRVGLIRSVH